MLLLVWFYLAGVRIASDWRRHFSRFQISSGSRRQHFIVFQMLVHDRRCNLTL